MAKSPCVEVEVAAAAGPHLEETALTVKEALEKALLYLSREKQNLIASVVFVALLTDEEMRRVNKETRGKDEPTTVLSFTEETPFPHLEGRRPLGDILLAPETIARRGEDIVRLALHGLLHLLGYTHDEESDTIVMEKLEKALYPKLF